MNEPLMIRFINRVTGTEMMVASDRVEDYKAAGHILAADLGTRPTVQTKEPEKAEVVKPAPVEKPKNTVRRKK